MREVKTADTGAGPHRAAFCQFDAGVLLDLEQLPKNPFLGMIRAGRITGGWTDAAIFFANQIFVGELLTPAIPPFHTDTSVQVFSEGFREAIGQRLGHDRVVIVMVEFEPAAEFFDAEARADRERAEVIRQRGAVWARLSRS